MSCAHTGAMPQASGTLEPKSLGQGQPWAFGRSVTSGLQILKTRVVGALLYDS